MACENMWTDEDDGLFGLTRLQVRHRAVWGVEGAGQGTEGKGSGGRGCPAA